MMGLVLGDWTDPHATHEQWYQSSTLSRMEILVVALFVTIAAWYLRENLSRNHGTYHYVRLLQAGYPDWHAKQAMETDAIDLRTATRWFDEATAWCEPGYLDLREDTRAISNELERATNDDSSTTGTTVVPNIFGPSALAVGYDWFPHKATKLAEYNAHQDRPVFTVKLARCASKRATYDPEAANTIAARTIKSPTDPHTARTVWLSVQATVCTAGTVATVDQRSPLRDSCDVIRIVGALGTPEGTDAAEQYAKVTVTGKPRRWRFRSTTATHRDATIAAPQLVNAVVYWIRQTLTEYPNATVMLSIRLPKTVSLAVGWQLSKPPHQSHGHVSGTVPESWTNPWPRLVTLGFSGRRLIPAHVRRDQVNPHDVVHQLTTCATPSGRDDG